MDWSARRGREWCTRGFTEASLRHDRVAPFDPKERDSPSSITWGVRQIAGRTFVIHTETNGVSYLAFHRREPGTELAPPSLVISKGSADR